MTIIATRVLIIHRQTTFAVALKRGLEQVGAYQVSAFQSAVAAVEYLQLHPQDVALVDLTLDDIAPADFVVRLRSIQPDMAIIACPHTPQIESFAAQLDLQGVFNESGGIRHLLPLLERAIAEMHDTLPDTAQAAPISSDVDTSSIQRDAGQAPNARALPEFDPVDDEIDSETSAQQSGISQSVEIVLEDDTPTNMIRAHELFERLAAEEPPLPSLEDSGTVSDLMLGVSEKNLEQVVAALAQPDAVADPDESLYIDDDDDDSDSPAKLVLISALDDTVPFDVGTLIKSIESQMAPTGAIRPLPSWVEEGERFIYEPDFLPDDLTGLETGEYAGDVTAPSSLQRIESNPQDLETDVLERRTRSRPLRPDDLPRPDSIQAIDADDEIQVDELEQPDTQDEDLTPVPLAESVSDDTPVPAAPTPLNAMQARQLPAGEGSEEDSYIAQLALHLTQVSLEVAAEATILAQDGAIVAHAGNLAYEELEDIRDAVADDWNASANQARIRFITLPASGQDYMLYSRQTDIGYTLTMIFVGNLPLHVIRRQSNRLVEALHSVPDAVATAYDTEQIAAVRVEEEAVAPPPEAVGPLSSYTYVWLLRDPNALLDSELGAALAAILMRQLRQQAWQIQTLDVRENYVYLVAEVPGEVPPSEMVRDLMRQSAEVVFDMTKAIDPALLWSDSYLIVKPGRELDDEEIQQFIDFARR